MLSILASLVGGFFSSFWRTLFPCKTAADQRADDLAATTKEANNAIATEQKIDRENLAAVESDLDQRVRDPNS